LNVTSATTIVDRSSENVVYFPYPLQYANDGVELSRKPTRVRERGMRKFKSIKQAQRFPGTHTAVYNLFNLGRRLVSAENHRYLRLRAFATWEKAVAI